MKNQARHSVSAPAQTYTLATARGLPWASDVPARCVTIKWLDADTIRFHPALVPPLNRPRPRTSQTRLSG